MFGDKQFTGVPDLAAVRCFDQVGPGVYPVAAVPELHDWLASELIRRNWNMKDMHRLILTSAVYQQDTSHDAERAAIDPENRLWWKRRPVRLEAEILRDSILAVSGRLVLKMGGPGDFQPVPPEAILSRLGQAYPKNIADGPDLWRRSVYAFVKRTVPTPLFQMFDGPDNSTSCGRRTQTTVSPQALLLMNDEFVRRRSDDFARRIATDHPRDAGARVDQAFRIALGRAPIRKYKGRTIRAVVLEDGKGFECDGERFRTLSALTKKITGSHMNGFRFFQLGTQR